MTNRSRKYIQVYKQHHGEIPKDDNGVTYDVHHIDGDFSNNDISNLVALSIREHYNLHKQQGDWGAAWAISKRLNVDPKEKSEITRQMNLRNAANGTHWSQVASRNGIHPFQDLDFQKYMAQQSKIKGNRSVDKSWICEKCGTAGKNTTNYHRYHGDNCGTKSKSQGRIWVNNGSVSKMISKNELEHLKTEDWVLGRGSAELTPRRTNANGNTGRVESYVRKTTRPYNRKILK